MSPSTADFSQIMELQQYRKLYEEQEEKFKIQMKDKEEEVNRLDHTIDLIIAEPGKAGEAEHLAARAFRLS